MEKIVRTVCQGCHPECGVLVHVEDGKVKRIEGDPNHPSSRGYICIKGRSYAELLYHPDRVKYPLKRAGGKGEGKWERISWEQALTEIAAKLTDVKERYAPESNAVFHGTGPRGPNIPVRLMANAIGTPNIINTDLHICFAPSVVAETFTVGHHIMMDVGPDYLSAKCVMVYGGNPLVSHPPRGVEILEAKRKNGAKLIVVDPRRTQLAAQADLWLQIRPGTDAALALGMINIIISEELYDKDFVSKWCHGFDELKARAAEYPVERVAEITWLPAMQITEAARMYATTKPAVLHHRVAMDQHINSTQTSRALVSMVALTGNIDIKGGNLLPGSIEGFVPAGVLYGADPRYRLDKEVLEKRVGSKLFPLISGSEAPLIFVHSMLAAEAMLYGKPYPIKAVYCGGGNPVVNMHNCRKAFAAFKNLELFVVTDFFMTPTAELADYVLPPATWLERDEICDRQYRNCIVARQKVIEPLFECWDDMKIIIELVKKIPWANRKFLPWNDVDEINEFRIKGIGMSFHDFKQKGYVPIPIKYLKYEEKGFSTPTGKVELYSTVYEKHGYDPVPTYKEPPESPVSTPELLVDYPWILITGSRYLEYYHSMGRQIPSLRSRVPEPEIEMHPEAASKLHLNEGDWAWIETPQIRGKRVKYRVKLNPDLNPRVVHAAHAWWFPEKPGPEHGCFESNISVLLSGDYSMEPVCGSVPLRGTLCKVYKCE